MRDRRNSGLVARFRNLLLIAETDRERYTGYVGDYAGPNPLTAAQWLELGEHERLLDKALNRD